MRRRLDGAFCVLVWLLAGCAAPRPWLAPLPTSALASEVQARQQLTMHRGDDTRSLQIAVRADGRQLTVIGLSALGQRLFTLTSSGGRAELTSTVEPLAGLDPNWILTDLQLVHWPLAALRAALPADLRLEQQGSLRTLWRGKTLLWLSVNEAGKGWDSDVTIYNLRLDYRLGIRNLQPAGARS